MGFNDVQPIYFRLIKSIDKYFYKYHQMPFYTKNDTPKTPIPGGRTRLNELLASLTQSNSKVRINF